MKDIITERLILRSYNENDINDFYEYISKPEVVRFEPYDAMTYEQAGEELALRMKNDEFIAVEQKDIHKMIGNLYLGKRDFDSLEIGYVFNSEFWGKGYAAEACSAVIIAAFSQGAHRIYAECDPENEASWQLLERLSFKREGFLKSNVYFHTDEAGRPIWKDTYIYSLLSNE